MSEPIKIIITNAGRAEEAKAKANGTALSFEWIEFGSGARALDATATALALPRDRVRVTESIREGENRVHLTTKADDPKKEYEVTEFGVITQTGVLFAVYSSRVPIAYKVATQDLLFATDIVYEGISLETIQVTGPGERVSLAVADTVARLANTITRVQEKQLELMLRIANLEAMK